MKYSIVVPMRNEAGNVQQLIEEIEPVMQALGEPWELICVDDGSEDSTLSVLEGLLPQKPHLRILSFSRNFGQSSAFAAGFQAARGEWVITLDGDGQNDPADIPKLIAASQDCDLVCGYRQQRRDPWFKRLQSWVANQIRRRLCGDGIRDSGCSLKIYRTTCLKSLPRFHGMHRFFPALFTLEGFRIKEIAVNHRPRLSGRSHYHLLNRSLNTLCDLLGVFWMRKRRLRYTVEKKLP